MKTKASLRYQLRDQRNAILVYYSVITLMVVLSLVFMPFSPADSYFSISSGGITAVTGMFAGVLSLCTFKDCFLLSLQHGVSRKSHFLARLGSLGLVCAIMAVGDEIYTLILKLLEHIFPGRFFASSLYEMIYCSDYMELSSGTYRSIQTTTTTILLSVVFSFFFLLAICSFTYLVSVLNFRLNKVGKIIFWVSWPALFVLLDAFLVAHPQFANSLVPVLTRLASMTISTLPRLCLTCLAASAVFCGITWLLMRRAHAK